MRMVGAGRCCIFKIKTGKGKDSLLNTNTSGRSVLSLSPYVDPHLHTDQKLFLSQSVQFCRYFTNRRQDLTLCEREEFIRFLANELRSGGGLTVEPLLQNKHLYMAIIALIFLLFDEVPLVFFDLRG